MSNEPEPGRDALVYDPSRVSWAVAEVVSMPPSSLARGAVYLIVLLIAGAVVFANFTSLNITVEGMGALRPSNKIVPVKTEVAGRIAVLSVKDGQEVKKDQVLVELEDQIAADDLTKTRALIKRLDALSKISPNDSSATTMTEAEAAADELMKLNISGLVRERSSLAQAANSLHEAVRAVRDLPVLSAADDAEREQALSKISKIKKQGMATELSNEINDLEQTVTRATVAIRSRREQAVAKVSEATSALSIQVRSFEQAFDLDIRSQHVLAPTDGVVQKVAVSGTRELVTAGQELLEIIPDGGSLIAEVQIANRDISKLKVGMPVDLRLDALPYQDYGALPGHIIDIPPDATTSQQSGISSYFIKIGLDRTSLDAGHGPRAVLLGMTLHAEIKIERKTLLDLAIKEVLQIKDEL
ncbi:MAG TPA: HlyD family efflux transporter periplasmic adaptor subunit [Kofleriaceae bacterium]